jgi:hypothetical protein
MKGQSSLVESTYQTLLFEEILSGGHPLAYPTTGLIAWFIHMNFGRFLSNPKINIDHNLRSFLCNGEASGCSKFYSKTLLNQT